MRNDSGGTVLFSLRLNRFWLPSTSGRKPGSCAGFLREEVFMRNSATRFYSTQMISSFQISLLYQSHIHSISVSERRALTSSLRGALTKRSHSFLASPRWESANLLTNQQQAACLVSVFLIKVWFSSICGSEMTDK